MSTYDLSSEYNMHEVDAFVCNACGYAFNITRYCGNVYGDDYDGWSPEFGFDFSIEYEYVPCYCPNCGNIIER